MVITFTIIKQDKIKILPNGIPKRIIRKMMQIYERFKLNKQKGEAQHNKNYGNEIITALPKKWIKVHKHPKNDTTIHYDMIVKPISRTWVIPPFKPSWPPFSYLIHKKKNLLQNLQQQFQCHGKLLLKEKNYLNDWNEQMSQKSNWMIFGPIILQNKRKIKQKSKEVLQQ